jgi:hypothetical protein
LAAILLRAAPVATIRSVPYTYCRAGASARC